MTQTVITTVYSNDEISYVAIVAADRDYIPLYVKLREIGKEIIGIGGSRNDTPELIIKACDRFVYHEELFLRSLIHQSEQASEQTSEQTLKEQPSISVKAPPTIEINNEEAFKLLVEALKALEAMGQSEIPAGNAISMIRRMKSDFDYQYYGYKTFNQLCLHAEALGLVHTYKSGPTYTIQLPEPTETESSISELEKPSRYRSLNGPLKALENLDLF